MISHILAQALLPSVMHQVQLAVFKRLYCATLSGAGRFKSVVPNPGETLLALMKRMHQDMLKWRPPGAAPTAALVVESKTKGHYRSDWRSDTWLQRHFDTGRTVSLRGTAGITRAGARRFLKNIPKAQRPPGECAGTIRIHDYQVNFIQRSKALTNSFAVSRNVLQWDEVCHRPALRRPSLSHSSPPCLTATPLRCR